MPANAAEGYSGLLEWADPIIFDRMLDVYGARTIELKAVWRVARLHARVWRSLIEGNEQNFESRRQELVEALAQVGLHPDCVAEADARALCELLAVVVDRFQRSPRVSMSYHLALLELAGRLAPTAHALAA